MCDLSADEREAILTRLNTIDGLIARIRANAGSITDRDWIDHATMGPLLGDLAGAAADAQGWVQRKVAANHH